MELGQAKSLCHKAMLRPYVVTDRDIRKICASILRTSVTGSNREAISNLVDEDNEIDLRIEGAPRTGVGLFRIFDVPEYQDGNSIALSRFSESLPSVEYAMLAR